MEEVFSALTIIKLMVCLKGIIITILVEPEFLVVIAITMVLVFLETQVITRAIKEEFLVIITTIPAGYLVIVIIVYQLIMRMEGPLGHGVTSNMEKAMIPHL